MFKKLNFKFDDVAIKKIIGLSKYIKKQPCELYGDPSNEGYNSQTDDDQLVIDYYSCNVFSKFLHYKFNFPVISKYLPALLAQKELPVISWQVIGGGTELPAHVDLKRKCAINFYIKANNETTTFYKRKRQGVFLKEKNDKYTSNELFIPEWLEPIGTFTASNLDLYAINTTVPHSVNMMNADDERVAVTFSFYKLSYEEVMTCLEN